MPRGWQLFVDDSVPVVTSADRRLRGPLFGYVAIAAALAIAIVIVVVAANGSGKDHPTAGAADPGTPTSLAPTPPESAPASSAPPTIPAVAVTHAPARVDLNAKGSVAGSSTAFTMVGKWVLNYDFDCRALGHSSSFEVVVYRPDGIVAATAVSATGLGGQNAIPEQLTGSYYLKVLSACSWHIVITS
jgi:hypothetical protein